MTLDAKRFQERTKPTASASPTTRCTVSSTGDGCTDSARICARLPRATTFLRAPGCPCCITKTILCAKYIREYWDAQLQLGRLASRSTPLTPMNLITPTIRQQAGRQTLLKGKCAPGAFARHTLQQPIPSLLMRRDCKARRSSRQRSPAFRAARPRRPAVSRRCRVCTASEASLAARPKNPHGLGSYKDSGAPIQPNIY